MKVTVDIPENKYQFFLELVKNLKFAQVDPEGDSKEEIVANLKQGFEEMKLYKQREMKGRPLNDLLNEL